MICRNREQCLAIQQKITIQEDNMEKARVWEEKIVIPTYEVGKPQKNPVFLEKRVYQGSSGKVYPYPTIETISDRKTDQTYRAVWLENEYLKVMILPELGGRIQRAYDKTNGYDFVYYNHVIKPALVGLLGPWISGGIEFNWPQHHRPTTFLPVDFLITENSDGSCSVLTHDVDQMYGTKGLTKITLYPARAYIEITGQLYNRTSLPQTFLWWANPAVPVNDDTQSVFPPDVHAVMDHGKRDVSRFPIATGVYYKKDYSEGVDISRYRNIPVPTSYMAEASSYDFVGGYDYGKQAGILHVADHHISPGKKQWTWGCGDFGKAWDRNLTDEDGPYVELMTGVFTDNQPDFTWLKPFEEKVFRQYFMPYKGLGQVKNATREAAVHLSAEEGKLSVKVYATGTYEHARILLTENDRVLFDTCTRLTPVDIFEKEIAWDGGKEDDLYLQVLADGNCLVDYRPEPEEIPRIPEPAKEAPEPEKIMTNEELYLTGQHLEQYRHATWLPDPYYLEGLKRDPGDIRINNAYGMLLMRRGFFTQAEPYFRKALERLTMRNPNPYNSESYYLLGLVLFYQEKYDEAYDAFYKAVWSSEQQEMGFYYLAALAARDGRYEDALEYVNRSLVKNSHNVKARGLKAYLLRKTGRYGESEEWIRQNLQLDPFDFVSGNERILLEQEQDQEEMRSAFNQLMRQFPENYLMSARDYAEFGAYSEAENLLETCTGRNPMLYYYRAFYRSRQGKEAVQLLEQAEQSSPDYCFPNKLEDIPVLSYAISRGCSRRAPYYLGCLFYDRLQWQQAEKLWMTAEQADPEFPTVHRNLALVLYNKKKDGVRAKEQMEQAFLLNPDDERIFLELDQLCRKLGESFEERLKKFEQHRELAERRDDLYLEYLTLLNLCGFHREALQGLLTHHFHPWEGGEGKVTAEYRLARIALAREMEKEGRYQEAEEMLQAALVYPENLGEGKLEGEKDNDIWYLLGRLKLKQGRKEEAVVCFEKATPGTDEPAGVMYYNDQPADRILYQGLAWQALGDIRKARARFYRLLDYGERHMEDEGKIGYFAVSLPDFLIFEEDYTRKNKAHCWYLMALANLGLGKTERARECLDRTQKLDPSHSMACVYRERMALWEDDGDF